VKFTDRLWPHITHLDGEERLMHLTVRDEHGTDHDIAMGPSEMVNKTNRKET
jgi:hypothetical protein